MSDPTTPSTEQKPAPTSIVSSLGVGTIVSAVLGLLTAAAGAGWAGVVAIGAIGLGIPVAWAFVMRMVNQRIDQRDLDRAGADAGRTAVDLANQGREVSKGLDQAESEDGPTDGFPTHK